MSQIVSNISSNGKNRDKDNRKEMRLKLFPKKCENISYQILYFQKKNAIDFLISFTNPHHSK